jgi:hypothetical protein
MTSAHNFLSRREFFRRATLGLIGVLFALRGESKPGESNQAGAPLAFKADEFPLRLDNGRYLRITRLAQDSRAGRLLWLSGGEEVDDAGGKGIQWNQPELLRVAQDAPAQGAALLAYLQMHHAGTLAGLWGQAERAELTRAGLLLEWDAQHDAKTAMKLPAADLQGGFTLAGWFKASSTITGEQLLLTMENSHSHLRWMLNPQADGLMMLMTDDAGELQAESGRVMLADGAWHHVVLIADEDAGLLRWVMDGACQPGWTALAKPLPSRWMQMALPLPQEGVMLGSLRVYNRALRTAEAAASYRYYGQGMGSSAYWG